MAHNIVDGDIMRRDILIAKVVFLVLLGFSMCLIVFIVCVLRYSADVDVDIIDITREEDVVVQIEESPQV